MSQPTLYRMNGLADGGSLVRDGVAEPHRLDAGLRREVGFDRHRRSARPSGAHVSQPPLATNLSLRQTPALSQPVITPVSPALRGGSVAPFAVRNELRSAPFDPSLATLQKMLGMALSAMVADANAENASLARIPNGYDGNNAATDWAYTKKLSANLKDWLGSGQDVAIVIGGADGLDPEVKQRAARLLQLSALTLPHGMVRVLLAEQVYRAWSLLNNHPYHRE